MKTLKMLKGLPACGKSTTAEGLRQEITHRGGSCKIINKDKVRGMLDNSEWSQANEKFVLTARDVLIREALRAGHHVIVDDTNLAPKHEAQLRTIAKNEGADFEVIDMTHIPLDVCLERDKKRPNYVGERVILGMYDQFLYKPAPPPEYVVGAPLVFICDLDGTTCLPNGRNPKTQDLDEFVVNDLPNKPIVSLVYQLRGSYGAVYVSGRQDRCRAGSEQWLNEQSIFSNGSHYPSACNSGIGTPLFMRATGDNRDDRIVKREIYEREIKGKYNVAFVLDDRDRVVREWRALGLTCLQVAPGNF